MPTRILLEGRPGAGKTTALRRLAALLPAHAATGFTTEEIRQSGTRVGFALQTLTGRREVLAHVDLPGPPRVGKYGVDLGVMERLALPSLRPAATEEATGRLVLIDELGRMELACTAFRDAVITLFAADIDVVATVHAHHDPFTDALKRRADIEVVHLTPANRDGLPGQLAARLRGPRAHGRPPSQS
ncbi:nucleoside-triphosphatase [Streptomyces sp. Ag109_G2-15]|uniref:nucleoside-triphosphatase n=1 Tax=Streptomyces sp. Ag109_G2-15 TaxID=1938850 RepID=UPI000BCC9DF6|nr:nucleoside-triphosphatase [Streptomyces sp. Ag109_G2-15]SOE07668.1 nucleoside-triphosphatase [Streptomyces sp. Ag109_G2-15]